MKKVYLMAAFILMVFLAGCKNEELKDDCVHREYISGRIIEIRENNEILIEATEANSEYEKGESFLIEYSRYYCSRPEGLDLSKDVNTPKLNDMVSLSCWKEEITEKDGHIYIPNQQVEKIQRKLYGRVIEVRDNKEVMIEVTKKQDQYERGDRILVGYLGYYPIDSQEPGTGGHADTPEYNDKIVFGYFQENIGEKDGYTYISTLNIQNYPNGYKVP